MKDSFYTEEIFDKSRNNKGFNSKRSVDKSNKENLPLKKVVKLLPHVPGVYMFLNEERKVIYVGKAKDLRNRVSSYFVKNIKLWPKTRTMVSHIKYIKIIEVQSELEAFLLEAELIKRYKPKYNIQLKDDKTYKHIIIDKIKVKSGTLWRVYTGRLAKLNNENLVYSFGPFADGKTLMKILRKLRKILPYANCSRLKFNRQKKVLKRPCLYGELGLCPAPCVKDNFSVNRKNILNIKRLLKEGYAKFLDRLNKQMQEYSRQLKFEKAMEIRDFISNLRKIESLSVIPNQYLDNPNLIEEIYKQRVGQIRRMLKLGILKRIECYDISNIMGKWATGSMVVSIMGRLDKNEYKRFKIKYVKKISDFDMMYEVLFRRLKHEDWPKPDMLLIDGGRGQVTKVLKVLQKLDIHDIFVVGIFKPNDYLVFKKDGSWHFIRNFRDFKLGWQHLRELRDEAHRFAKGYHKKLRTTIVDN